MFTPGEGVVDSIRTAATLTPTPCSASADALAIKCVATPPSLVQRGVTSRTDVTVIARDHNQHTGNACVSRAGV